MKTCLTCLAAALLLSGPAVALAQGAIPEDPGPPPSFDMGRAEPAPEHGDGVVCDANWCVLPGVDPSQDFPGASGSDCWNSNGPVCIMASNGDAASQWLSNYAFWQTYTFGNYLCVALDECVFDFSPDRCIDCDIPRPVPAPSAGPAPDPGAAPTATPVPVPASCPAPTIAQGAPVLAITKVAPNFPLVVGQDPERRGADIEARVTIPPAVFTWYGPVVEDRSSCDWVGPGNGSGCASDVPGFQPRMAGDDWAWVTRYETRCERHVEVHPEPILSMQATASLDPASRRWITRELSARYYEAYLHRPDIGLLPAYGLPAAGCGGDGTCLGRAMALRVPFADPGTFALTLTVQTGGTPVTQPRTLAHRDEMQVSFIGIRLVQGNP